MQAEYKLKTPPVTLESAEGQAKALLESAKKTLGFVPNMYGGMAIAPGLLDTYMHGYLGFRNGSGFTAAEQESIFLAISRYHGCEYCVSAHSMLAEKMSGVSADTLAAIREWKPIADNRIDALIRFTEAMVHTRGQPSLEDVRLFLDAGYTEPHILWIILAVAVKTISNYSNHVNQPALDEIFQTHQWKS